MNFPIPANRRHKRAYLITPGIVVTELFRINEDEEAIKEQWVFFDLNSPVSLPLANMALISKNLIEERGWEEINSQKHLSMEGLHVISYQLIENDNQVFVRRLVSSSKITEITSKTKNKQELLIYADVFRKNLKLNEGFHHQIYKKEELCRYLNLDEQEWHKINSLEDLFFHTDNIQEWIRFAFYLHRKDFFLFIFEIVKDTFDLLNAQGIKFLLPITEKNIIFFMLEEVEAVANESIVLHLNQFLLHNNTTGEDNLTGLGILKIDILAETMKGIPQSEISEFWKRVKQRRKVGEADITQKIKKV